jgi:hypothetical protein
VDTAPGGDEGGRAAVPGVFSGLEGRPGPVLFRLDVDGELFAVREDGHGGTAYDWLNGPNDGYGFGSSASPTRSAHEHRATIRTFLAQIDPRTGYIGDA